MSRKNSHKKQVKRMQSLSKQAFRGKVSLAASYVEIYLSIIILIGIVLLSINEVMALIGIGQNLMQGTETMEINDYLGISFNLIIGVEFVKMLAKHTPDSTVEVVMFALARQLIVNHESLLESLLGVIAIAVLFAVRKYLSETITTSTQDEYVVNSGVSIEEINGKLGMSIGKTYGNTIAGLIYNVSKKRGDTIEVGYSVVVEDKEFQVYSMDADLIKQVKILEAVKKDHAVERIADRTGSGDLI